MKAYPLFGPGLPPDTFREVDLSIANKALGDALRDPASCQRYLDGFLAGSGGRVAYGGYLERRALYQGFSHFNPEGEASREFHLGVDFWAPEGTVVYAPWDGKVHSWANRTEPGDYGPVILLEHTLAGQGLFSLYGHLSEGSLIGLYPGKEFRQGEALASLGGPAENGGYAPHLHFQLIRDPEGYQGDYPGVCARASLEYYRKNCPDPLAYLGYF
ncbi:peptidoglycan DD-metalloendopeptidase family protein [Robiginitalea marina]|uniref:Peptidoglycan DD-metalloendopeptidase family protein n=1 Tax=Robiginitalea marina TaxID=2954105 RepID=A0ABT1AVA6_9FLAO|nr:peptidoglycan DD-metalloendopeptidase family protein [Robiginitalea marina]MCO5724000.1 peptidoglycan DD-metalloendopeptidase family protein [Robiginitalea marina]